MKTEELLSEARMLPKPLREEFLRNHCTNVEIGQYFKRFDGEDLTDQQRDLALKSIELSMMQDEFDMLKAEWNAKIKVKKEEWKSSLTLLKQNGEWLSGEQYMFADQKRGVMEYYDKDGEFISSRRLLPEEKQMSIFDTATATAELGMITKSKNLGE